MYSNITEVSHELETIYTLQFMVHRNIRLHIFLVIILISIWMQS